MDSGEEGGGGGGGDGLNFGGDEAPIFFHLLQKHLLPTVSENNVESKKGDY